MVGTRLSFAHFLAAAAVLVLGNAPGSATAAAEAGKKAGKTAPKKPAETAPVEEAEPAKAEPAPADPAPKSEPESAESASSTPASEEDLRLGPFAPPPRPFPFPLLGDERAKELFVDRDGQLYRERKYSGHIPDWNEQIPGGTSGRCRVEAQNLSWVGFQNNADGSRIYVQLEKSACGYVYRPDDRHIVIDLPQVSIPTSNLRREILTGAFPTSVEYVRAEDMQGRGTRVVISLKEPRPYLSSHLGRYVFVDVTR